MKATLIKNKENVEEMITMPLKKQKKAEILKSKTKIKISPRKRPSAPHNTSLYLIQNFEEIQKNQSTKPLNECDMMSIDSFISIGGTMKGSFIFNL